MQTYQIKIKRFNPEDGRPAHWDTFSVELAPEQRILDAFVKIKDLMDGTLTFRKSCAHAVCGSCAVMINGRNMLACQTLMKDLPTGTIEVEPLPALPVIKDLVVDMEPFFKHNDSVMPYLINNETPPERERLQSPEEQHKIVESITCIQCSCCSNSCPSYWTDKEYLGPSAMLKAYRFIYDTRDRAGEERLQRVMGPHGLWRCHGVYNCVEACPKEIDITRHLNELKRLAAQKGLKCGCKG